MQNTNMLGADRYADLPAPLKHEELFGEFADWKEAHGIPYREHHRPCPKCKATGEVSTRYGWQLLYGPCPDCLGDGEISR